jgi:hypothetical protein
MDATGVWIGVGAGLHASAAMLLYFLYRAKHATAAENDTARSTVPDRRFAATIAEYSPGTSSAARSPKA